MKKLKKIYFKIFKRYEILERIHVSYQKGDRLIKESCEKEESEKWIIDTEREDKNKFIGVVFLCRKKRIVE